MASSCDTAASSVLLLCLISDYWPQDASVAWLKNDKPYENNGTPITPVKDRNGMYSGSSMLNVSRESWNKEDIYTCQVTHYKKNFKQTISKSIAPDGEIVKPSFKNLFQNKRANVSCKTNVGGANIQFLMNGIPKSKQSNQVQIKDKNIIWTQITEQINLKEWKTMSNLSCLLQPTHEDLQKKLIIIRTHKPEEVKAPTVYLLPPAQESVVKDNTLALVCLVKDYYPEDLIVTWRINDSSSEKDVTESSLVNCNLNTKRCSITSQLSILKGDWLKGTSYSCLVAHISSDEFIRRNISVLPNKTEGLFVAPEYYIMKPSFKEIFLSKTATIKCITNVLSHDINWLVNGTEMHTSWKRQNEHILINNVTWVQSTIEIPLEEWINILAVSCKLNNSQELNLTNTNVMKEPKVYVLPPASESKKEEEQLTLICLVKDFYPEDVFVTWKSNNTIIKQDVPEPKHVFCDLENQYCSFVSHVSISKEQWLGGMGYQCLVAHISSKDYISKNISKYNVTEGTLPTHIPMVYQDVGGEDFSESEEVNNMWTTASTFIALFLLTLIYSSFVTFIKVK